MDRLTHNEFEHVLCISAAATKVYGVRVLNCRVFREIEGATTWKTMLHTVTLQIFHRLLRQRRLHDFQFSENVILNGSAVLQITLDCEWHNIDLDIYCIEARFDDVCYMLEAADFEHRWVSDYMYPVLPDDDADSDNECCTHRRTLCRPSLREFRFQAVHTWSHIDMCTSRRQIVDVIVGLP